MKVLFIGGTGNISTHVSRLAVARGMDLHHLNRGRSAVHVDGVKSIVADIHNEKSAATALAGHTWDCVVDWIAFTPEHIERDLRLFAGRTRQFIFISSASAYQKPLTYPVITESTPLRNPFWEYSRNKIACEERLLAAYRDTAFPSVIVRPSHTYDTIWPLAIGPSRDGTIIDRMKRGAAVIVHGDGLSLWTLTHSADFARAFVGLLGNPQTIGNAYHITSDERLTWNQIHEIIAYAVGGEPNHVHVPSHVLEAAGWSSGGLMGDKAWSVQFDNSKIKALVPDYRAAIPFHVGVHDIVEHFRDPALATIDEACNRRLDAFIDKWRSCEAALRKSDDTA